MQRQRELHARAQEDKEREGPAGEREAGREELVVGKEVGEWREVFQDEGCVDQDRTEEQNDQRPFQHEAESTKRDMQQIDSLKSKSAYPRERDEEQIDLHAHAERIFEDK